MLALLIGTTGVLRGVYLFAVAPLRFKFGLIMYVIFSLRLAQLGLLLCRMMYLQGQPV